MISLLDIHKYVRGAYVYVFQDSDLKQYLDNCGNLMSMHNVKVSHR